MADYILTRVAVDETVPLGAVDQITDAEDGTGDDGHAVVVGARTGDLRLLG